MTTALIVAAVALATALIAWALCWRDIRIEHDRALLTDAREMRAHEHRHDQDMVNRIPELEADIRKLKSQVAGLNLKGVGRR